MRPASARAPLPRKRATRFAWPVAASLLLAGVVARAQAEVPEPVEVERPARFKVSLGGGVVFLDEPFHEMSALRVASQLGVTWLPGSMPGEIGLSAVMDQTHFALVRADLRYFFYKGPVFSQFIALGLDLVPSTQYPIGGGGLMLGFEWAFNRRLGLVWSLGADMVVYPPAIAPPLPLPDTLDHPPTMFGYLMPSSVLALQVRF